MKISNDSLYKIITELITNFGDYENSYETRLQTQKVIYLFEVLNNSNYYDYSWYLAGPYSAELSRQIYQSIIKEPEPNRRGWENVVLNSKANEIIDKIRRCIDQSNRIINRSLQRTQLLELIGSIVYIAKNYVSTTNPNRLEIVVNKLKLNKPQFADVNNLRDLVRYIITFNY